MPGSHNDSTSHELSGERLARLRLIRSNRVGPRTFLDLLKAYGSAEEALCHVPQLVSSDQAHAEYARVTERGACLLLLGDADYPALLTHIPDPPIALTLHGNPDLLQQPCIAMVGARNASINGKRLTQKLAQELGEAGITIVSGLARGVDAAAHEGALATGTVAVVAGGADIVYPREHQQLYEAICTNGLVVAEMPLGTSPRAEHFPRRNRIISGLCSATLVMEAARRSGSLITARLAAEQGRDVMAVPGFPLDPRAGGPNHLIQQGATLITNAQDVLDQLQSHKGMAEPYTPSLFSTMEHTAGDTEQDEASTVPEEAHQNPTEEETTRLKNALSTTPVALDTIAHEVHMPMQRLLPLLLKWELNGELHRLPGNRVVLATD